MNFRDKCHLLKTLYSRVNFKIKHLLFAYLLSGSSDLSLLRTAHLLLSVFTFLALFTCGFFNLDETMLERTIDAFH